MGRNKQEPLRMSHRFGSVAAGTNIEYTFGTFASNDIKIIAAHWTPEHDQASTNSNSVAWYIATRDSSGAASNTVASWSIGTAAATTVSAFVPNALTVTGSLSTVSAGKTIQMKMVSIGSGLFNYGAIDIEYILL